MHEAILVVVFMCGMLLLSYRDYAEALGWPIGAIMYGDTPPGLMIGVGLCVWAVIQSFWVDPWWFVITVFTGGWVAAFFLCSLFRSWSPTVAFLLSPIAIIAFYLLG